MTQLQSKKKKKTEASMSFRLGLVTLVGLVGGGAALDNRVADTPPRGWCSWQRYRCHIACNDSTSECVLNNWLFLSLVSWHVHQHAATLSSHPHDVRRGWVGF